MPDGLHAEIEHGDRIQALLKVAPREMKAALRKAHAKVGREVRGWVRSDVASASPQQRHMGRGVGSSASSTEVRVTIGNTVSAPGAMGAFLGAKRYPQFPRAIKPGWKVAGPGGPLVVNPSLHKHEDDIETVFLQSQLDAAAHPFPKS